jgi:hypothetical protein
MLRSVVTSNGRLCKLVTNTTSGDDGISRKELYIINSGRYSAIQHLRVAGPPLIIFNLLLYVTCVDLCKWRYLPVFAENLILMLDSYHCCSVEALCGIYSRMNNSHLVLSRIIGNKMR